MEVFLVLEVLTGTGLAMAAGLNAYIPLLALGISARFFDVITLPGGWAWLENEWVLAILGLLLVIEFVADKIPAVDSVNDWIQTVVRPTAGGLAFGSGSASETVAVTDPGQFFASNAWVPIATGVLIALAVHIVKMAARPLLNLLTAGLAAPVSSVIEDAGSILLTVLAMVVPILIILAIPAMVVATWLLFTRIARRRRELDNPRLQPIGRQIAAITTIWP